MINGDADKGTYRLLRQALGVMIDFRITAYGLVAMAIGLHAIRWLVGHRVKPGGGSTSQCASDGASSSSSSPVKSSNGDGHRFSPRTEDVPPSPSRALADHPLLGPAVFGTEHRNLPKQDDTPQSPEHPARKTRVKMLRFEQPDANGFYKNDHQAQAFSPKARQRSPRLASPRATEGRSALKSPYADVTDWTQPHAEGDHHLPVIPEDKEEEKRQNGHRRGLSSATDKGDSTPFSTSEHFRALSPAYLVGWRASYTSSEVCPPKEAGLQAFDLVTAPTQAGDAITDEHVSSALAVVEQLPPRRHSRSYSESNLASMTQSDPELQSALRTPMGEDGTESSDASPDYFHAHRSEEAVAAQDESQDRSPPGNDEPASSGRRFQNPFDQKRSQSVPPLLRLEIITGPSRGRDYNLMHDMSIVGVGRNPSNLVIIEDSEVSNHHIRLSWGARVKSWLVQDLGSTNGTRLNGNFISLALPKPGKTWKLSSDDILLLGHQTSIKVSYLARTDLSFFPFQNRKLKVNAPPSQLVPCVTMKSEAIASLRAELGIEKAVQEKSLRLDVAMICHTGAEHKRLDKPCEDVPFLGETGSRGAALYCVFDGHCGTHTSNTCASLLPETLRKRMASVKPALNRGEGLAHVWEEVFLEVDSKLDTEDGTTATAVLVWRDLDDNVCLQTANVGDSAAVLYRSSHASTEECEQLTGDHRVAAPAERQRLADLGIELKEGANRLYGLNLSRCLGDRFVKEEDLGFSAVPAVSKVVKLPPEETALVVLASDGLWDVAKPTQVMEVAYRALLETADTEEIGRAVYQLAMDKRTRDDITIIVLRFCPEGSL